MIYCCARCGSNSDIHIHHKNGDRNDNRPENLIALCRSCHYLWHRGKWTYAEAGLENVHVPDTFVYEVALRRMTIPSDLWDSLTYHVSEEKAKVIEVSQEAAAMITNESMLIKILEKKLRETGHYPPKTGKHKNDQGINGQDVAG